MNKNPVKVMLSEDHRLVRLGIKAVLEENHDFEVVAEAETGAQTVELALKTHPDVLLLDLGLPDMTGLKVIKKLHDAQCPSKIVVLSAHEAPEEVTAAVSSGINAYVIKDISSDMLKFTIKSADMGAIWLDPKVVPVIRNGSEIKSLAQKVSRSAFRKSHANLTQREYEVLKLIADGKSNAEIAEILCISEHTAKAHVCSIIQKMVVDDRTQAAVKALKEGLIS